MRSRHLDKRYIEEVGKDLQKLGEEERTVSIEGLYKVFDTPVGPKIAVNDLNVTMYEGQIFCLLGHNGQNEMRTLFVGAGKTTAISMLCGMIPATSRRT